MWDLNELAKIAAAGLANYSAAADEEQAVYGLDALTEVELHPLLENAFLEADLGAHREWPYPGEVAARRKLPARERCDLVITPQHTTLVDPVAALLETDKSIGTLFETLTQSPAPTTCQTCHAADAFWLEVKLVGQYCYTQGIPGPNRSYASELTSSLYTDLAKLARDQSLRWAGLLLVLFSEDQQTAEHDLSIALHKSLDRGHSFRTPIIESLQIPDRIGNRHCTAALIPK